MKSQLLALLLVALPVAPLATLNTGCAWRQASPRDIAASSIKATAQTVDRAMEAYAEVQVQGKVSNETHTLVEVAHARYRDALSAATTALEIDYRRADVALVSRLAGELTNLIIQLL